MATEINDNVTEIESKFKSLAVNEEEKKPFPLLRLPPEIWITICEFAAEQERKEFTWAPELGLLNKTHLYQITSQPAITRVCRNLRAEVLPYALHHTMGVAYVCLNHPQPTADEFGAWLRVLSVESRREFRRCALVVEPALLERMKGRLRDAWSVGFEVYGVGDERTVAFWESLEDWERPFLRKTVHAVRFL